MTYKELVDDIQVQFKSHNESEKTQNPYWILFRLISEINAIRDELLVKIPDMASVPEWMIKTSRKLNGVISNSGAISGIYDEYKFAKFVLPETFPIFRNRGIVEVVASMRQRQIFLDDIPSVILRIKAEDESLKSYFYGFVSERSLMIYPYLEGVYVKYLPIKFCANYSSVVVSNLIPVPELFLMEARKRILESVILQKQIPEDDWSDGRDGAERSAPKNRQ